MSIWNKINNFSEGFARGYIPASQNKYAYQAQQKGEDRREATTIRREDRQDARQSGQDQITALEQRAQRGDATVLNDPLTTSTPGLKANLQSIIDEAGNKLFGGTTEKAGALSSPGVAAVGSRDLSTTRTGIAAESQAQSAIQGAIPSTGIGAKGSTATPLTGAQGFKMLDRFAESTARQTGLEKQATGIQQREGRKVFSQKQIELASKSTAPVDVDQIEMYITGEYGDIATPKEIRKMAEDSTRVFNHNMVSREIDRMLTRNVAPDKIEGMLTDRGWGEWISPSDTDFLNVMQEPWGTDEAFRVAYESGGTEELITFIENDPSGKYASALPTLKERLKIQNQEKQQHQVDALRIRDEEWIRNSTEKLYNDYTNFNEEEKTYNQSWEQIYDQQANKLNYSRGVDKAEGIPTDSTPKEISDAQDETAYSNVKNWIEDGKTFIELGGKPITTRQDLITVIESDSGGMTKEQKEKLFARLMRENVLNITPPRPFGGAGRRIKGAAQGASNWMQRGLNTEGGGGGFEKLLSPFSETPADTNSVVAPATAYPNRSGG